jgi:DNA-binding IscR family transcriptional regulator
MTECAVHAGQCSHEVHCGVRGPWQRISQVVVRSLREVSLAEMIAPAAPSPPDDPARIAIRLA